MVETRKSLDDRLNRISIWLERHSRLAVVVVLANIFLIAIGLASHKLLWYDELVTVFTADLPSSSALWHFYADGLDTTGPVSSFVARWGMQLPLAAELSARLPFILAFLCMCLSTFGFVRRRYATSYALAALVFPLVLPNLYYYMTEARAYALMLCGAALGMYFWQTAADGKARPWSILGLWLALAIAIAAHFFAVFLFVPFAVAQLTIDWPRRRPDWPVWAALFLFPAGFLPFLHGTQAASKYYSATFHSRPSLRSIEGPYRGIYFSGAWLAVSMLILLAVWLMYREANKPSAAQDTTGNYKGFTNAEWVFAGVLTMLPVYEVIVAFKLGVFRDQYAIAFYIGLVLVIVCGVAELSHRSASAGVLVLIVVLATTEVMHVRSAVNGASALVHLSRVHANAVAKVMARPWLQTANAQPSLPIAVDFNSYMDFNYYGPPEIRRRIYSMTDAAEYGNPTYAKSVSDQQNLKLFSRMLPLKGTEIDDFLAHNPHFLVLTNFEEHEWLPDYLLRRQQTKGDLSIKLLSDDESGIILDVQMK